MTKPIKITGLLIITTILAISILIKFNNYNEIEQTESQSNNLHYPRTGVFETQKIYLGFMDQYNEEGGR